MTTLIWIFAVSAMFLISMLSYRSYELASGKRIISDEKRSVADSFTLKKITHLNIFLKRLAYFLKNHGIKLWDRAHVILHELWVSISTKIDHYFDKLRGCHGTGKRGVISLYWQESKRGRRRF